VPYSIAAEIETPLLESTSQHQMPKMSNVFSWKGHHLNRFAESKRRQRSFSKYKIYRTPGGPHHFQNRTDTTKPRMAKDFAAGEGVKPFPGRLPAIQQ